jgi:osmoprotectant transport system permease protein
MTPLRTLAWLLGLVLASNAAAVEPVVIGAKKFTESVILAEMAALLIRDGGAAAQVRELGGTRTLWQALVSGQIDLYPEYTGTLLEEILAGAPRARDGPGAMQRQLQARGIRMTRPLGFNNTYALGMAEGRAAELGVRRVSDLRKHPELRFGFSNEFMDREDGWPGLRRRYGLPQTSVTGLDHDLA